MKISESRVSPSSRGVHRITRYSIPNFNHTGTRQRLEGGWVMHIDMDAFFAQVEQVDFNLRGIPLIIGSWVEGKTGTPRGIVATASYEARKFGIRTGMSHMEARRRCPYVVALKINYEKYRSIAQQIQQRLCDHSDAVEMYSMDEFFIQFPKPDTSNSESDALRLCKQLQQSILAHLGLTCSVGIARSKSYAKLASALNKPSGVTALLSKHTIRAKAHPLPISKITGIGPTRARDLEQLGVRLIKDAFERGKGPFQSLFGPHLGALLWQAACGTEVSPVHETEPPPASFHHIHTFSKPTTCIHQLRGELMNATAFICHRLRCYELHCQKWEVYLRFDDIVWEGVPIPIKLLDPSACDATVLAGCWQLTERIIQRFLNMQRRFLGIGMTALLPESNRQLRLDLTTNTPEPLEFYHAMDRCNFQTGGQPVRVASNLLASTQRVHFLEM